jgi:hypothetical protein
MRKFTEVLSFRLKKNYWSQTIADNPKDSYDKTYQYMPNMNTVKLSRVCFYIRYKLSRVRFYIRHIVY